MIFVAPLSLFFLTRPSLNHPISFSNPGITLEGFCKAVSPLAKVPLTATGAASSLEVTIRIDQQPLSEVLKKIEEVTFTRLDWTGKSYKLSLDHDRIQDAHQKEIARRTSDFESAIERVMEPEPTTPLSQEDSVALAKKIDQAMSQLIPGSLEKQLMISSDLELQTPVGRAFLMILSSLPVKKLVQYRLLDSPGIVFSSQPLPDQLPIDPAVYQKAYSEIQANQPAYRAAVISCFPNEANAGTRDYVLANDLSSLDHVEIESFNRGSMLEFILYNALLQPILKFEYSPSTPQQAWKALGLTSNVKVPPLYAESSPENHAIDTLISSPDNSKDAKDIWIEPATKAMVLHPDLYDPLRCTVGEEMVELAKLKGFNLIMPLDPEFIFHYNPDEMSGHTNLMRSELAVHTVDQVTEKNGWYLAVPSDPSIQVEKPWSDTDLAKYLAKALAGKADFDSLAKLAAKTPSSLVDPLGNYIDYVYISGLRQAFPGLKGLSWAHPTSWPATVFWGLLTPQNKAKFLQQTSFLGNIPKAAVTALDFMVMDHELVPKSIHSSNGQGRSEVSLSDAWPLGLPDSGGELYVEKKVETGIKFNFGSYHLTYSLDQLKGFKHPSFVEAGAVGFTPLAGEAYDFHFTWQNRNIKATCSVYSLRPSGPEVASIKLLPPDLAAAVK